jgi:hypothetical protein
VTKTYRDGVDDGLLAAVGIVAGSAAVVIGIDLFARALDIIFPDKE